MSHKIDWTTTTHYSLENYKTSAVTTFSRGDAYVWGKLCPITFNINMQPTVVNRAYAAFSLPEFLKPIQIIDFAKSMDRTDADSIFRITMTLAGEIQIVAGTTGDTRFYGSAMYLLA